MTAATETYPIAGRFALRDATGVRRRALSRVKGIPDQRDGVAVVLDIDGDFELVPAGEPVHRADGISRARGLLFVDMTPTTFSITCHTPSADMRADFTVQLRYRCQVQDAAELVRRQIGDVRAGLESWTNDVLRQRGHRFQLTDAAGFELHARQVVVNALRVAPPLTIGCMHVALVELAVELEQRLRQEDQKQWDTTQEANQRIHEIQQEARRVAEAHNQQLQDVIREQDRQLAELRQERILFTARQPLQDEKDRDEQDRRETREQSYLRALQAGPDAVMARIAAENPEAFADFLGEKLKDRERVEELLLRAIEMKIIDEVDVERGFLRLADGVIGSRLGLSMQQAALQFDSAGELIQEPARERGARPGPPTVDDEVVALSEDDRNQLLIDVGLEPMDPSSEVEPQPADDDDGSGEGEERSA